MHMNDFTKTEIIKKFDRHNMLDLLLGLPAQCRNALELSRAVQLPKNFAGINKIVISGMGGSAVSGDILRSFLSKRIRVPILVNRGYTIPHFVDSSTLFFVNSYSGNTEETLSAFEKARAQGAKIIGVSSNGKVAKFCRRYSLPLYSPPGGQPPRSAIGYLFFPLLQALISLRMVRNINGEIEETIAYMERKVKSYAPERRDNLAHTFTRKVFGYMPIIYGSGEAAGTCAFRWKTQFNENSKVTAFSNTFPELDHNEIMGWEGPRDITKKFVLFVLKDKGDSKRMEKRIKITLDVIGKKLHAVYEICGEGRSPLTRMFSLILLGDFLTFYMAIARGVDPTAIKGINILKERLAKS